MKRERVMDKSIGNHKKGGEKRLQNGKEIMKHRPPADLRLKPARFESDQKKAYAPEQLAEIGAITLKCNPDRGAY